MSRGTTDRRSAGARAGNGEAFSFSKALPCPVFALALGEGSAVSPSRSSNRVGGSRAGWPQDAGVWRPRSIRPSQTHPEQVFRRLFQQAAHVPGCSQAADAAAPVRQDRVLRMSASQTLISVGLLGKEAWLTLSLPFPDLPSRHRVLGECRAR